MKERQTLPAGWTEKGIESLIAHYDKQSEDEQAAEIEEVFNDEGLTMVAVPVGLVNRVHALIAAESASARGI